MEVRRTFRLPICDPSPSALLICGKRKRKGDECAPEHMREREANRLYDKGSWKRDNGCL